ncbi:MAG: UDP-N-acetylmuramate:L-alanyl-gamma-D-glutamyl-meso-diaminopimelate ligase [Deltaproteobacteria bacterium]|nr:UDP-N-acetylmuramate:L-alanyl-gamma-D-glutamyl-meso-diaminopimelate ligase [Deltaproteobacteria bacterium]
MRAALPARLEHVHLIAIAGTGMGALAGFLRARGLRVTGSDRALYPPMSEMLAGWGIPVSLGFEAAHLEPRPDLVVIGNAVRPDNPEARAAIEGGIPYRSFPDALHELAMAGRHAVVVAGTHGKTTTTSLLGALLAGVGLDPSVLVGGVALDFEGPFRDGSGPHFVVEGDEYDTAFFDKTPKFLHYHPRTLLLTSVEFDHADIYRDLAHVQEAFRALVRGMPAGGAIVAALDDPNVCDVLAGAPPPVVGYGLGTAEHGFRAVDLDPGPAGTAFRVLRDGTEVARARVPLYGRHNVANALGALATAVVLGAPVEAAAAALARFRGVRRRQEVRGTVAGVTVLDDFAHHPTAVRETVAAMRARFPGRRLVAVLEPRSNTSRRALFQADFAEALAGADRAVVAVVPHEPIYSNTGVVTEYLDAGRLAEDLRAGGVDAEAIEGVEAIVERLGATSRAGDVVLVMSNGDFGGLWGKLLERLGRSAS